MIHEGLHSVSGALSTGRLDARNRAWEEGIVEKMQRLLRQRLLRTIGVTLAEEEFLPDDIQHLHNQYIRFLEQIRGLIGEELEPFYLRLLRSSADGRAAEIVAAVRALVVQQDEGTR